MQAVRADLVWLEGAFEQGRAVVIDGDRIHSVAELDRIPEGTRIEDWGPVAIIPGPVNAHGHSFQSLFKGMGDDRDFASWRDDVLYPFSTLLSASDVYAGALFAFSEALLAGTTTTVDFFYLHDGDNEVSQSVFRAARDTGIRLVFGRTFYDLDAPTGAPARYRERAEDAAARTRVLAAEFSDDSLISVQPAPHSLHAASPETIALALETATELDAPCHLHLAEASYEVEQVRQRYGATPVRLLAREGLLDSRLVTVHTVWVDDEELDLVAGARAGVVHCPGANAFLGDGVARVPEMLRRGIRVGLGPDGGCANNHQSVFDEMRTATLVAKARLGDGSALDAPTAFRLGTAGGADLLGLEAGRLKPGAFADLVALDLDDLSLQPLATLDRQVVHSMQQTAIARVMVGGETVVDGGRLVRVGMDEVRQRVAETTRGWTRP
jgi:5-methylthioadenosine/S-adenosylhomocysteine deaminase